MLNAVIAAVVGAATAGLIAVVNQRHQRRAGYKDRLRSCYADWINATRALAQLIYNQALNPKSVAAATNLIPTSAVEDGHQPDELQEHLRLQSLELFVRQAHAHTSVLLLEDDSYWRKRVQGATSKLPTSPRHPEWKDMVFHLATELPKSWPPFEENLNGLENDLISSEHLLPERAL